jgi:hypothetical protein
LRTETGRGRKRGKTAHEQFYEVRLDGLIPGGYRRPAFSVGPVAEVLGGELIVAADASIAAVRRRMTALEVSMPPPEAIPFEL